jgi:hypothetical protein
MKNMSDQKRTLGVNKEEERPKVNTMNTRNEHKIGAPRTPRTLRTKREKEH